VEQAYRYIKKLYRHLFIVFIFERNAVNAGEHDAVIFTGSGCTGAVHKLIHALGNIQVGVTAHKGWTEGASLVRKKKVSLAD
jgi:hypothetical protein